MRAAGPTSGTVDSASVISTSPKGPQTERLRLRLLSFASPAAAAGAAPAASAAAAGAAAAGAAPGGGFGGVGVQAGGGLPVGLLSAR